MAHPSLSLITHDGDSQGKTVVYITRMTPESKKDDFFATLLRNLLRRSLLFIYFYMLPRVDRQHPSVLFIFFITRGLQQLNQPTSIVWTRAIRLDLERDTELTGSCLRGGARPSQHVLLWPSTAPLWSAAQCSCLERPRYWEKHYPSRADKRMHTVRDKVAQRHKTFAMREDSYLICW